MLAAWLILLFFLFSGFPYRVFAIDSDPLVLVSQMLLDVVSLYNKVTDLTDRKQAVKISIGGVQVCLLPH